MPGKVPPWGVQMAPDARPMVHWGEGGGSKHMGGGGVPLRWGRNNISTRLKHYSTNGVDPKSRFALVEKRAEKFMAGGIDKVPAPLILAKPAG